MSANSRNYKSSIFSLAMFGNFVIVGYVCTFHISSDLAANAKCFVTDEKTDALHCTFALNKMLEQCDAFAPSSHLDPTLPLCTYEYYY